MTDRIRTDFVDREDELRLFREMLAGVGPRLLYIRGDGGMGKSSLREVMSREVMERGLRKAEVVWSESRNYDYMGIMRRVRDDLGEDAFAQVTDLINFYTVPQYRLDLRLHGSHEISVLSGASLEHATVRSIGGIVIQDMRLENPRSDMSTPESERMIRLTDAFLACLQRATTERTTVLFFDAAEKMSGVTSQWLWDELLDRICDGALPGVRVVFCSRSLRSLGRKWRGAAEIVDLKRFSKEHIEDYLDKRGVDLRMISVESVLNIASDGNVLELALLVDGLESEGTRK